MQLTHANQLIAGSSPAGRRHFVRTHPLLTFSVTAIALTWLVQFTFLGRGWSLFPSAIVIELVILAATATVVTRLVEGRPGVRRLYAGVTRWRFGARWYVVTLLALPVATVLVATVGGTLIVPADGWAAEIVQYLFLTIVFGALLGNLWEELAWTGFLQSRLTDQHGMVKAVLWTSLPFGLIHWPLVFDEEGLTGTSASDVAVAWALLLGFAPVFRALIGMVHAYTRRSLLAVALLHGSFNASLALSVAPGRWEYLVGTVAVTAAMAWAFSRRTAEAPTRPAPAGAGVVERLEW